ncbi:MAG: hypothetical protein ED557_06080 [Balneola sp.]|nr:MAG: hypothetical protein ED557_06080 [Balneola sp.]
MRSVDCASGNSFIEANIWELNETGFMSNRGRQNVSSISAIDYRN